MNSLPFDPVAALALTDVTLTDVAGLCGGELAGDDAPISHLRPVSTKDPPEATLSYAVDELFLDELVRRDFAAAILTAEGAAVWGNRPAVIHPQPAIAFYQVHTELVRAGAYGNFPEHRGVGGSVATSAKVHPSVWIGDDVEIGDHVTLLPNTALADGVRIQAGTVIAGDGFQVTDIGEGRFLVPHAGGVVLGNGVSIGSNCCVDKGLFSAVTSLGPGTMLDNLVHVAHDVTIGKRCTLTAKVELSGVVTLDDDVWLAPNTSCNQFIRFGRGAYTGTGSVVVRDVAPFTLVRGNPAKPAGHMCLCRTKLGPFETETTCGVCGRRYRLVENTVELVEK